MKISRALLRKAKYENLVRLAEFLRLRDIHTMSHRQLINLVYWRISREEMRARGRSWYG